MKRLILTALLAAGCSNLFAGAVLNWTLPTTHVNGSPLAPQSSDVLTLSKDGAVLTTLAGTATTYTDASAADCALHSWALTFTETATKLASSAATATQPIDTVGCSPKPVTGLTAK